ncbi:MAG TPA: TadE family protein [Anaerolineales bacterium]|nr:TadE family protein [Anaerolineales bacterium]
MHNPLPKPVKEHGQSLVELALSLMFLLILLGGIVDLGRAFFTYMALRDAVQEGALYGSINPTLTVEIKDHVINSGNIVPDILSSGDITVSVLGSPCTGNSIRIQAVYNDFPITMPFIGTLIGRQTVPIRASITDTILSPACP